MASRLGPSPIPVLRPQKPLHMPGGDGHRGKSLKLLEKIPEDAEATVVLVGEEGRVLEAGPDECPLTPGPLEEATLSPFLSIPILVRIMGKSNP